MRFLLLALLLAGCEFDHIVSSQNVGEPFTERRRDSCTHMSYCYTCAPGFDAKLTCGLKFSGFCPGSQEVEVRVQRQRHNYKSGDTRSGESILSRKEISSCS